MLSLKDAVHQCLRDTRGQKLRTFLTVFGIVWGTVAVTLLLAFGQGLERQVVKSNAGLGDRIAIAWPGLTSIPFEGLGRGRSIRIRDEDLGAVAAEVPGLKAIPGENSRSFKLHYGTKTLAVYVAGVSPVFGGMRNLIPQPGGRFLDPIDDEGRRRVVFLGNKLADDVFGATPAVGRTVSLDGSPFLVVGVLVKKEQDSNYNGPDGERAWMPGSTYRALTGEKFVENFVFQSETVTATPQVSRRLQQALGRRLRFDPGDKQALSVWDTTESFAFLDKFFLAFRLFLGIVGSLTLVVGGIGVSNIMNVVVEERTREIGVKMALGARPGFILRQLLLETLLVTGAGGALGFALALGICAAFPKLGLGEYIGDPRVSPQVAAATVAILGLVGFLAGYFPARDASRMDPVVAMKS